MRRLIYIGGNVYEPKDTTEASAKIQREIKPERRTSLWIIGAFWVVVLIVFHVITGDQKPAIQKAAEKLPALKGWFKK